MKELGGKVVVVTGGSGVLGSELVKGLAASGAKVAVLGRDLAKAEALAESLKESGAEALGVSADVCSEDSVKNARDQINSSLGKVDILVNGAGGNHPDGTSGEEFFSPTSDLKNFFGLGTEGIRFVFDLNFMGTLIPSKVFMADMIGREGCSVANISSMSAFSPLTKVMAYGGAKAAINNFTQWLAVHFAKEGIRVNAIAPGFFLTEQNRSLLTKEDGSLTERGNKILEHTPMGRFGDPADLVGTLLWLCSDSSRFVTGIVVPVDGGFSAYSGV